LTAAAAAAACLPPPPPPLPARACRRSRTHTDPNAPEHAYPYTLQVQRKLYKEWNKLETAKEGTLRNRGYRYGQLMFLSPPQHRLCCNWHGADLPCLIPSSESTCHPRCSRAPWVLGQTCCRMAQAVLAREDPRETFLKNLPSTASPVEVIYPVSA
jgi:hypothetical protein